MAYFSDYFSVTTQLKQESLKSAGDSLKVHLLSDLCYEYRLVSQDSAILFGRRAIELAKYIKYEMGEAQAHNDIGIIYSDLAEFDKANNEYRQALAIRVKHRDSSGIAAIHSKLGVSYQRAGQLDSALIHQFEGLKIYEALESDFGISYTLNNIAIVFFNKGDMNSALEYHEKALSIRIKMKDNLGISGSLGNIGNIYLEQKNYTEAIVFYKEGLAKLANLKSRDHEGSLCNNLATAFLELGEKDSAKTYIERSILIRKEINDIRGLISNYHNLAMIHLDSGDPSQAEVNLNLALELAEIHGVNASLSEIHRIYLDLKSEQGDYRSALEHSLKLMDYKDKMTNESSLTTIAELQTKYETEKKEQQIALQKAEIMEQKAKNSLSIATIIGLLILLGLLVIITMLARSWGRKKHAMQIQRAEIRQREIQIEAALNSQESERKRFARDLHDGFGQMISVLNLNLNSLKSDQSDREQLFQNSRKVLDDMYKELKGICFNLMPETLIKSGVVDAIKEFALRVNNTGKVVMMVDTFGLEQRLMDLQEISIYRITQEWVNNILKYSDADKITISLTRDEEEITLLIEDNGPGFDKQNLIQGTGNGWKNMNSRSNLIKGELELDTTPGLNGTTLILNLPYKIYQETKNPSIEIPS